MFVYFFTVMFKITDEQKYFCIKLDLMSANSKSWCNVFTVEANNWPEYYGPSSTTISEAAPIGKVDCCYY